MPRQPTITIGFEEGANTWNKLTYWIRTPTKNFSEVHHMAATAPLVYNDANYNAVTALLAARAECLADNCTLYKWVVSQENVWRDSIGPNAPIPNPMIQGENENLGNDCLEIYFTAGPLYRRTMYMGAIPDSSVTGDRWVPGAGNPFFTAVSNYLNILAAYSADFSAPVPLPTQSRWGSLFLDNSSNCPVVNVLTYSIVAGQSTFNVTLSASANVLPGNVVRISGAAATSSSYPVNQLWTVRAVAAGNLTLTLQSYPFAFNNTPLVPLGGKLQCKDKYFQLYDSWSITGPGKRNRGNRQNQPVGRRKRKYNIGYPG